MKFRKKPVIINAVQWTGENEKEIIDLYTNFKESPFSFGYSPFKESPSSLGHSPFSFGTYGLDKIIVIFTLEGKMTAFVGDWIIRGVDGEFYPCKPKIFEETYEMVE